MNRVFFWRRGYLFPLLSIICIVCAWGVRGVVCCVLAEGAVVMCPLSLLQNHPVGYYDPYAGLFFLRTRAAPIWVVCVDIGTPTPLSLPI